MSSLVSRTLIAAAVLVLATTAIVLAATKDDEPRTARGAGNWVSLADSPLNRSEVGAARIGDKIYVVGGFRPTGGTAGGMAAYDISDDSWRRRATLPGAVNHPGVTSLHGKLYVLGGQVGGNAPQARTDLFWRYSPKQNKWRRLHKAPTKRGALGLVGHGRKIYAIGGYGTGGENLRKLEVYDLGTKKWRTKQSMPTGRNHLAAVWANGELWAIGGRQDGGINLDDVESYDPGSNSWKPRPALEVPRSGIAAAVAEGTIVAFGGEELDEGDQTIEQVEQLDLGEIGAGWNLIEEMTTPRHGLGGAAKNGVVYALLGGPAPALTTSRTTEGLDLNP